MGYTDCSRLSLDNDHSLYYYVITYEIRKSGNKNPSCDV